MTIPAEQWFDGRHFYVKEMCVRTERQRTGVGSGLLRHLEDTLRALGVSRTYLLTLRAGAAEAFYARNGYTTSPRMGLMGHRL